MLLRRLLLLVVAVFGCCIPAGADDWFRQEQVQRHDFRRSVDKRFTGMSYGYNRSVWTVEAPLPDGTRAVSIQWTLAREARRDLSREIKDLQIASQVQGYLDAEGQLVLANPADEALGLPARSGYPAAIPVDARPGDVWKLAVSLPLDPDGDGLFQSIPATLTCRLEGASTYQGTPTRLVRAQLRVLYQRPGDAADTNVLLALSGSRDVDIHYRLDGQAVFMREKVIDQTVQLTDGRSYTDNGFVLTFWQAQSLPGGIELIQQQREEERQTLDRLVQTEELLDAGISSDDQGLSLTLRNLRFAPDSAVLLPEENRRLDALARALASVAAHKRFLVVGHTADAGTEAARDLLSRERARVIVQALLERGITAERLSWIGRGSREPLGDNTDEAGRALNRRVEIRLID